MTAVFADTVYYVALLAETDVHHAAATRWSQTVIRTVVTDYVFLELGNMRSRSRWRGVLPRLIRQLRRDPAVEVVSASQSLMDEGLAIYERRRDKEWSLTDCISFVVMREHGLTDALTADHHFEQAGFRALLREGEARGG